MIFNGKYRAKIVRKLWNKSWRKLQKSVVTPLTITSAKLSSSGLLWFLFILITPWKYHVFYCCLSIVHVLLGHNEKTWFWKVVSECTITAFVHFFTCPFAPGRVLGRGLQQTGNRARKSPSILQKYNFWRRCSTWNAW